VSDSVEAVEATDSVGAVDPVEATEESGERPSWPPGLPPSNRLPIAAVALGIASIPFGILTGYLGLVCGLLAVIIGILGIRQVRRGAATRRGLAIAGVVAGGVGLVVSTVVLVISIHRINDCKQHIGHTPSQKELTQCARDHI